MAIPRESETMKIDKKTQTHLRLDDAWRAMERLLAALKDEGGVMAKGKALARIEHCRNILTQVDSLRMEISR